ncbi:MAG: helical backbone metal receptor [Myxococcota bacterium]
MRVVSLCPSTTETVAALGKAEALVGITRFCIHPAAIVERIPKVGGTKDPDQARIEALAPDLILMNREENRQEDHAALSQRLPQARIDVTHPTGVAEVPELLLHFGRLLGAEPEAEAAAEALRAALLELDASVKARPRLRAAYLIWKKPWMAVGGGTYVDALLCRAGLDNVFREAPVPYPEISLEALVATAPELILLPDEPFPFDARHAAELSAALPRASIQLVSGDDCCWHGTRSIRGVALMQELRATR